MNSLSEILTNQNGFYRNNSNTATDTSIELPAEISELITGSDYWKTAKINRYKKLIREGNLNNLLELARIAKTKNIPANWFAKVASKAEWTRTLDFLSKLKNVAKNTAEVLKRISVPKDNLKVLYKFCWKLDQLVVKHAITAQETGEKPFNYFIWLCSKSRK